MPRALSLFLPMWSVRLAIRRTLREEMRRAEEEDPAKDPGGPRKRVSKKGPDRAILLVSVVGQQHLVVRCCEYARAAGIRPGMSLAHARALLPLGAVETQPFTPERDDAALRALAHWALKFSPVVAPDPPDGLLIDIT